MAFEKQRDFLENAPLDRYWSAYKNGVKNNLFPSLEKLGISGLRKSRRRGFVTTSIGKNQGNDEMDKLTKLWDEIKENGRFQSLAPEDEQERKIFELGIIMHKAARVGDNDMVKLLLDKGVPVNFQHPTKLSTALHQACATNAFEVVDTLLSTGECDFLIQDDRGGKIPWHNAELLNIFPLKKITEPVLAGTKKQAQKEGFDLLKFNRECLERWKNESWYQLMLHQKYPQDYGLPAEPFIE